MKKKVLQVVNIPFVLPYFFGDQISYLKQNGLDITICCSPGPELDEFCLKYNIKFFPLDIRRKIDPITDLRSVFKLSQFIKKENFDFVVGHTPKGSLLAMVAAYIARTNHRIYFRHGIVYETDTGLKRRLMTFLERTTSYLATKIISVSQSVMLVSQVSNLGAPSKNVLINKGTCNGIDLSRFSRRGNTKLREKLGLNGQHKLVGFVGRLVNDKGINELIEAWKMISQVRSDAILLLVGPFEDRDSLPIETKEQILSDESIVYVGNVSDTVPYYNIMDVFILPSYREGFPTVVLEASAMALPVITTRSTGCIDSIIEGETGMFTSINAKDIAKAMLYYLENPSVGIIHGENGRAWVSRNFKQEVVWENIKNKVFEL